MAISDLSIWRSSAILDLQKLKLLITVTVLGTNMRHHAEICVNRSIRCRDMAIFRFLKDGGRPPCWIFKNLTFLLHVRFRGQYASFCQIWCRFISD